MMITALEWEGSGCYRICDGLEINAYGIILSGFITAVRVLCHMSEEQAQQLMHQLQALEQYAAELSQRESALVGMLRDGQSASDAVRALGEKDASETMVPIGMGVYVKTKVTASDPIALNVGAGTVIERDRDAVLNFLEERIKEVQVALQDTSAKRQDAMNRLEQGKAEASRMFQAGAPHKHG